MKVLCINGVKAGDKALEPNEVALKRDEIYEGEVYTAIDSYILNGEEYYILAEKEYCSYLETRFVLTSEYNEKDLNYETNLEA